VNDTEDQLWDLLREAHEMPYGAAQIAAVEHLIPRADAMGLTDLAFRARMLATSAYVYGGEPAKSVVTFSWCLAEHDRDPVRYQRARYQLLWHLKYMVSAMLKAPEVPLDRTYAVLDEMQRRYLDAGYGLHAVHAYRHHVARHVGDLDAAGQWFEKWRTTPRDDMSDCVGCDPTDQVRWLHETDRDEEAVALAEPVLAGRLTCVEQPQQMLTELLVPLLRTGRLDRARDAHRHAYLRLRPHLADLAPIGDHVHFCTSTGNHGRALEIVERHLPWLDRAPSPYAEMYFAACAARALTAATATAGDPPLVHVPGYGDRTAADVPADVLAARLAERAVEVVARFDARNGTGGQSERVRRLMAAPTLVDHLPLGPTTSRHPAAAAAPEVATASGAAPRPEPGPEADATPAAPSSAGPDDLLDLAEDCYAEDQFDRAVGVWRAFDERFAGAQLTALQRARRRDAEALMFANRGDNDAAEPVWREAIELYAQAGDEARTQQARGRLGLLLCETGREETGVPDVAASTAWLRSGGSPRQLTAALLRLARAESTAGRTASALAALDEALDRPDLLSSDRNAEARVLVVRAHLLGASGDPVASREAAERARALCRRSGYRTGLGGSAWLVGLAAEQMDDRDAALDAYEEALTVADGVEFRRAIRAQRAGLLAGSSRAAEGVDDLADLVAEAAAAGDGERAARLRHQLAIGYLNCDRLVDAAEAAEETLAWFGRSGEPAPHVVQVRHLLATVYRRLDQPDQAIAHLESAATDLTGLGNLAGTGQMLEEIGEILDWKDRDAAAAARFLAAAHAYRDAGLPLEEARATRRHATSLLWSGAGQDAVAALAEADRLAAALPDGEGTDWERALLGFDGAQIFARTGQSEAALDRASAAADAFRRFPAPLQVGRSEWLVTDLLMRAGRAAEAERAARRALAELPERARERRPVAALLADALVAQDRLNDAEQVRREHGLT
jgi:tetratricopeptide (TPR) repeat protein